MSLRDDIERLVLNCGQTEHQPLGVTHAAFNPACALCRADVLALLAASPVIAEGWRGTEHLKAYIAEHFIREDEPTLFALVDEIAALPSRVEPERDVELERVWEARDKATVRQQRELIERAETAEASLAEDHAEIVRLQTEVAEQKLFWVLQPGNEREKALNQQAGEYLERAETAEAALAEICICAAVLTKEGAIFRGHRHDDAIITAGKADFHPSSLSDTQGFITSRGRYVSRAEGARLQAAAGIKSVRTQLFTDLLFSEDLY